MTWVSPQLQQERSQVLELAREVHTEKAHADRARQEVDALTQTKRAVEAARRQGTFAVVLACTDGSSEFSRKVLETEVGVPRVADDHGLSSVCVRRS